MELTKKIIFDLNNEIYTKIEAKQNDIKSRYIEFTLTNGGVAVDLTGHTVKIFAIKADNTVIFNNVQITDATNGKVLVQLTSQALAVVGELQCELDIYGTDNSVLSSKVFTINVLKSIRNDSAVESTNEFSALTEGIATVTTIANKADKTYVDAQDKTINNKIGDLSANGITESSLSQAIKNDRTQLSEKAAQDEVRLKIVKLKQSDLDDTLLQQIVGNTPINAVPAYKSITAKQIMKSAINGDEIAFLDRESINLFNKFDVEKGYIDVNGNVTDSNDYLASGSIYIDANTAYSTLKDSYRAEYDISGNLIRHFTSKNFTTSQNAVTVRISVFQGDLDTEMLVKGNVVPNYEDYYKKIIAKDNFKIRNSNLDGTFKVNTSMCNFIESRSINLFDPNAATDNAYIANGNIGTTDGYVLTGIIKAEPLKTYKHNGGEGFYEVYNNDMVRVSPNDSSGTVITTPADGEYIRATIQKTVPISELMIVEGDLPSTYIPYDPKLYLKDIYSEVETSFNPTLNNKIWNGLGDSITSKEYGNFKKYHDFIVSEAKMQKFYNYGYSGTTIARRNGETTSFVERYSAMVNDADIITVFGGTNDFEYNVPLGDMNSTDEYTFYGALKSLCIGLLNKYPGKRIGFFTPLARTKFVVNQSDITRFELYITAVKAVCAYYSIPCLDLYRESGLSARVPYILQNYFDQQDGLHPNELGHAVIKRRIMSFIESI